MIEYFATPEKFLFIDVHSLDLYGCEEEFQLSFFFNSFPSSSVFLILQNIRLHCTPVVNLYEERLAPIIGQGLLYEFPLASVRDQSTEIHSVQEVHWSKDRSDPELNAVRPYFSSLPCEDHFDSIYWWMRRERKNNKEVGVPYLSLVPSIEEEHFLWGKFISFFLYFEFFPWCLLCNESLGSS